MAALDEYASEKVKKILKSRARKELNEDPKQIQAHLTSFRRWLSSMPHLSCITDDDFLLAFLRHAKYNHQRAQTRLDNFCTFRTSETLGRPDWFKINEDDFEVYKKLLDMRMSCPIGILEDGTYCLLVKIANYDFTVPYEKAIQLINQENDVLLISEGIQIGGLAMIFDYTGATTKQLKDFFSPTQSRDNSKYFQEAMPFRTRKMIFYNMPSFFDGLFRVAEHYLNDKIRSRLMVLSNSLEPAMDALPGLKAILPKDYGGNGKLYNEKCDQNRPILEEAFLQKRDLKITVDESKRPTNARNLMKIYKDIPPDFMGKTGTFVKLNEDEI